MEADVAFVGSSPPPPFMLLLVGVILGGVPSLTIIHPSRDEAALP